ncbi:2-oxoglutarate dehydrogenase complex dihydrolipoyllysine-residue succinyltransferase [Bacteroidota bacterium]
MAIDISIPTVGESITEVTISKWMKEDGESVDMDDVICELESDKATFELNAEAAGVLVQKVKEGETVPVGTVIASINDSSTAKDRQKPLKTKEITQAPDSSGIHKTGKIIDMIVPTVGESITEVNISSWNKSDGDFVELDEVIAEIDSDKATFELTAETSGYLKIIANEGDTLEIGALICQIEEATGTPSTPSEPIESVAVAGSQPPSKMQEPTYAKGHPSPAAAKILAEKGIATSEVEGTGIDGRITKEDAVQAKPVTKPSEDRKSDSETESGSIRRQRREKLSTLRKTVSRRLVAVKNQTAMLTTFNEVNMAPIMDLRKKYKEKFQEKYEVNLGFMSFFTKACCIGLQEWPAVNAMLDGEEIVYNDFCDISIAVSAPKGLVVPVVRNAESLSFARIEHKILELATKARDNKLSIEEMTGGTFTITNGGVFGSMLSTPIINAPQSAILGMHNIVQRPVAENGEIRIRPVMYVALSYDHRIVDGRESVGFLVRVKELLEDPARLLLEI